MTKEEFRRKFQSLPSVDSQDSYKCTNLAIEYAIGVLEEVANPDYQIISDGQCGVISIPQDSIYDKIKELKSLIR